MSLENQHPIENTPKTELLGDARTEAFRINFQEFYRNHNLINCIRAIYGDSDKFREAFIFRDEGVDKIPTKINSPEFEKWLEEYLNDFLTKQLLAGSTQEFIPRNSKDDIVPQFEPISERQKILDTVAMYADLERKALSN